MCFNLGLTPAHRLLCIWSRYSLIETPFLDDTLIDKPFMLLAFFPHLFRLQRNQGVSIFGIKVMQKQPERVGVTKNAKTGLRDSNMQNLISSRIGTSFWLCDGLRGVKLKILDSLLTGDFCLE